jgi:hypothetical protein
MEPLPLAIKVITTDEENTLFGRHQLRFKIVPPIMNSAL